ncbi:MAG: hypothetical protein LBB82_01910 [Treponema sp.]|jgi:hypothetical protein|nr:hypothetical protein [Treponema sp.]
MAEHETNNQLVRELNRNSLRSVSKHLRAASKEELSRITGIEGPFFEELTAELCSTGELLEEPAGGALCYRFNARHRLVLAICVLEKNKVCAAVSDLYGEFLDRREINAQPDTLEFFDGIVESYRAKYPAISMLAFGMAGFEVRGKGPLLSINFPQLEWRFRDHFMDKYRLPSILENDIKAAVSGFYHTRAFGEGQCVTGIYLARTHHPAAGICIDGRIYRGRDNAAGEVIFLETPVKWRHFSGANAEIDYSKVDVEKLIGDMAVPLIVYLNPDCLVVYCNWLPEISAESLKKQLVESIPREFLPDIVLADDILPDFLDGLVHRALTQLEPKIELGED